MEDRPRGLDIGLTRLPTCPATRDVGAILAHWRTGLFESQALARKKIQTALRVVLTLSASSAPIRRS